MDSENHISININSANIDALTELQGVGRRLAERIIKERPFENIEDLTRVRGISKKDVERLRPFLTVSVAPEQLEAVEELNMEKESHNMTSDESNDPSAETALDEFTADESDEGLIEDFVAEAETAIDEAADEVVETAEEIDAVVEDAASDDSKAVLVEVDEMDEPEDDSVLVEAEVTELAELKDQIVAEPIPEELDPLVDRTAEIPGSQPEAITRGGACSLIFIGGLLTLIVSVIITLGVLASFNNGQLSYATPYQIAALQSQTESLSVQASTLAENLDGLRLRIDNLEALSGRVSEVETEVASLQDDVAGLQAEVASTQAQYDELTLQIEGIDEQIDTLTAQSDRFESFLDGLRTLMEGLFPENVEAEVTP